MKYLSRAYAFLLVGLPSLAVYPADQVRFMGGGLTVDGTPTNSTCVDFPPNSVMPIVNRVIDHIGPDGTPKTAETPVSGSFNLSIISSISDLQNALGLSAGASASGLWGSGDVETKKYFSKEVRQEDINVFVNLQYHNQGQMLDLKRVALRQTARDLLLKPGGLAEFYRLYGSRFFFACNVGASYKLFYQMKSLDTKTTSGLQANVAGRVNAGYASYALKAAVSQTANFYNHNFNLQVTCDVVGVIDPLPCDKTDPATFESIKDKLHNQLNTTAIKRS